MVISYAYLWRHQQDQGRDEGGKDRPCVVELEQACARARGVGSDGLVTQVEAEPAGTRMADDAGRGRGSRRERARS